MSASFSSVHGVTKKNLVSKLMTSYANGSNKMKYKDKVTSGLGATHGLHKFTLDSNLNTLLEKVSNFQFKEYFLDFDRLRKGYVSESRFRSGLGMTNAEFSESDIQDLLMRYRISGGEVDYKTF